MQANLSLPNLLPASMVGTSECTRVPTQQGQSYWGQAAFRWKIACQKAADLYVEVSASLKAFLRTEPSATESLHCQYVRGIRPFVEFLVEPPLSTKAIDRLGTRAQLRAELPAFRPCSSHAAGLPQLFQQVDVSVYAHKVDTGDLSKGHAEATCSLALSRWKPPCKYILAYHVPLTTRVSVGLT